MLTDANRDLYLAEFFLSYHFWDWLSIEETPRIREMEHLMRKRFMQFVAVALAVSLCIPGVAAARRNSEGETMIRVGLASSSTHNPTGELACAQLQNNTGYGVGFRFGYYDSDLNFMELGRTDENVTQVAVLKTQNMYGYYDSSARKYTYSDSAVSSTAVGCYHIQIPGSYMTYKDAAADAKVYGGFVAWIDGAYQVRVGAYLSRDGAEGALATMEQGTIVGTSSYGVNVVETGTDRILFQFDGGSSQSLGILPDVTGADDVRTWFSGFKYRGGFTYQRVTGGNLTVVNVLDLETYVKGVVCYEMGREWPLEALKTQAICARTYALKNLNTHKSLGFDVCNTDSCQVYNGVGSGRSDYGPSATSDQAVEETAGQVAWYNDQLATTFYSSSHGGASESANYIWGTNMEKYPYLCGVEDPYEQEAAGINAYSSWSVSYTASELTSRLQSKGYGVGTKVDALELTYSELGNVVSIKVHWANGQKNTFKPDYIRSYFGVRSIRFTVNGETANTSQTATGSSYYTINGNQKREDLDGLYVITSNGVVEQRGKTLYTISGSGKVKELKPEGNQESSGTSQGGGTVTVSGSRYVFDGAGWGHQVGMSQYGAYAMAQLGFTGKEIVEFYFPGTTVGQWTEE